MGDLIRVGVGGFIGAVLRFTLSGLIQGWTKSVGFPYGTLGVNILGCLVIGTLAHLVENRSALNPETRLAVFIGVLGAFTTFSTFSLETLNLFHANQWVLAFANILMNTGFCLLAVWLGWSLASIVWR